MAKDPVERPFTATPLTLRIKMPRGTVLDFPLQSSPIRVGRASDNDIVLDDDTVTRYHAQISVEGSQVYLQDMGSTNGTYLGDARLAPGKSRKIAAGDRIRFGKVKATIPGAAPRTTNRFKPAILFLAGGGIILLVVLALANLREVIPLFSGQRQRLTTDCETDPMVILIEGGQVFDPSGVQASTAEASTGGETAIVQPLLSTAFLDLPFPYDGDNENFGGTLDQFRLAVQRNTGTGGRINSYFDHYLPIYPAPADPDSPGGKEQPEPPVGKNIVAFDGLLNPYISYSGHPGIDFSTFIYRKPTTPVFAAADGTIAAVGVHGTSGALYVKINHEVQDVGAFQTIYWHLHSDTFYSAMLGREGEAVRAGERIGTMGNTGYSTGHHLHFEVRFDLNSDGIFTGSEVIDPFGWTPSAEFIEDPWYQRSKIESRYLWVHPLGTSAQVPLDGGGQIAQPGGKGGEYPVSGCARRGALPPGGTVFYSWAPDPDPDENRTGVGQGCVLSVLDAQDKPVLRFNDKVKIVLPFDQADLSAVDAETLTIYWQAVGEDTWTPLDTTLDLEKKVAIAETDLPGRCSLMGKPLKDLLPPQTEILLSGLKALDGSYYGEVQVSLKSTDLSGVSEIYYSLDNGTSWLPYSIPFTVQPSGIPALVEIAGDFFGGLPGTYLVLASAVDSVGNIENPPAQVNFSINPSKNPDTSLETLIPSILEPLTEADATPASGQSAGPQPPDLLYPLDGTRLPCLGQIILVWSSVSDPDGIREYQWELQALQPGTGTYTTVGSGYTNNTGTNVEVGCGDLRFAVRAIDKLGNIGPYSDYLKFQLYPFEELDWESIK